jgi:hypothetical protein
MKNKLKLFATFAMLAFVLIFASLAQADETRRITFAKGKSSATIDYAVLRDEVIKHPVRAGEGQRMTVRINATEDNAAFTITTPTGEFLAGAGEMDDATEWSGTLPESGDYVIEVGSTRGNADYRLTVSIK